MRSNRTALDNGFVSALMAAFASRSIVPTMTASFVTGYGSQGATHFNVADSLQDGDRDVLLLRFRVRV